MFIIFLSLDVTKYYMIKHDQTLLLICNQSLCLVHHCTCSKEQLDISESRIHNTEKIIHNIILSECSKSVACFIIKCNRVPAVSRTALQNNNSNNLYSLHNKQYNIKHTYTCICKNWKFGAMHFIYQINRLTTTKVDSTYLGWLANNAQRICPVRRRRARTHDHRISSQRLTLSRHTGRQNTCKQNLMLYNKKNTENICKQVQEWSLKGMLIICFMKF